MTVLVKLPKDPASGHFHARPFRGFCGSEPSVDVFGVRSLHPLRDARKACAAEPGELFYSNVIKTLTLIWAALRRLRACFKQATDTGTPA